MKKKILVVENDADICMILSHILSEEGYEPIICNDYQDVFENIRRHNPDVIILDVIRPTEAGTELCRTLKSAESTKHIPVIVLSTHARIEEVKQGCADEIVKKPFDIDTLVVAVKQQLAA
jgi:DNA-binding response OmpR family regulator